MKRTLRLWLRDPMEAWWWIQDWRQNLREAWWWLTERRCLYHETEIDPAEYMCSRWDEFRITLRWWTDPRYWIWMWRENRCARRLDSQRTKQL